MASKVKFPIYVKLVLAMSGLVLAGTAAYLAVAIQLFESDKTELVYELNASSVKTVAAEVENSFQRLLDKTRLLSQGYGDERWVETLFQGDPDLVAFSLYRRQADWEKVASVVNDEYLKLYGLTEKDLILLREQSPVPHQELAERETVVWNSTLATGAPLLSIAVSLDVQGDSSPWLAVLDVKLDRFLKMTEKQGLATVFLIDHRGAVIAHPNGEMVKAKASLVDMPIVQDSLRSPAAMQLKRFDWRGERWLGAFASVGTGGLKVISQVRESEAFRAAHQLIRKSILFAAIVLTASILVAGWISGTLTRPLKKLLDATERLARWQFSGALHVKSRDEVGALATAFNSMALDIQRQKTELDRHQEELELRVRERTASLEAEKEQSSRTQEALLRTTKLASLGELAGVAAHEILNPLNNINIRLERIRKQGAEQSAQDLQLLGEIVTGWKKSYAEGGWEALEKELKSLTSENRPLVEEDLENLLGIAGSEQERSRESRENVDFIATELNRIARIINNMRALSRVGGERKAMDVHAAIEDTTVALSGWLEKQGVSLVRDFSSDPRELFTVVADKDELVQVFSNLIRNAVHAIGAANRRAGIVKIQTRRSGDQVEVRVIDNGAGIPEANRGRIFEPNFTTKSAQEGTGLGLSICRRLVRAFGGDVELESTQEFEGATFLVRLPFVTGTSRGQS